MREIHRDIVGVAIVSGDGKVFLAKSNPAYKGSYESYWVIPGGGIEEGETAEQAGVREVMEETGIDLSPYKLEKIEDTRKGQTEKTLKTTGERVLVNMDFIEFRAVIHGIEAKDIKVALSDEHSEYGWFEPALLSGMKISPPSLGLFKQLGYIG